MMTSSFFDDDVIKNQQFTETVVLFRVFVAKSWLTPQIKSNDTVYQTRWQWRSHFALIGGNPGSFPGKNGEIWPMTSSWRHMVEILQNFQETFILPKKRCVENLKSFNFSVNNIFLAGFKPAIGIGLSVSESMSESMSEWVSPQVYSFLTICSSG